MASKRSTPKRQVEFTRDPVAILTIRKIVTRALVLGRAHGIPDLDPLSLTMDLSAAHVTCPLRLDDLLTAGDFDFMHDVFGIRRHLDRDTGELGDGFRPRFALPSGRAA